MPNKLKGPGSLWCAHDIVERKRLTMRKTSSMSSQAQMNYVNACVVGTRRLPGILDIWLGG
ncbi:MAG: hypothetical protein LUQ38_12680 [Methanotrichaceae archaeon]|nr:hypothetical protein [Methanotrichaceae archaeon]